MTKITVKKISSIDNQIQDCSEVISTIKKMKEKSPVVYIMCTQPSDNLAIIVNTPFLKEAIKKQIKFLEAEYQRLRKIPYSKSKRL